MTNWIFWIVVLTFGGYIYNRIVYWISAIIWELSMRLIYNNSWWFYKNTTLYNLYCNIKYSDGVPPSPGFEAYAKFNDGYEFSYITRWLPGINIITASISFCLSILMYALGLLIMTLRLIYWIIGMILYPYFFKYVIIYIWKVFVKLCKFMHISNLFNFMKSTYNNTILKLQNLRIA